MASYGYQFAETIRNAIEEARVNEVKAWAIQHVRNSGRILTKQLPCVEQALSTFQERT